MASPPVNRDALDHLLESDVVDAGVIAPGHPFDHHRVTVEPEGGTVEIDELEGPHVGAAGARSTGCRAISPPT